MTNTLHRYGDPESLKNDYIIFAIATRAHTAEDKVERLREFLRLAAKFNPVNLGDGSKGSIYRPSKSLNPTAHWRRKDELKIEEVIEGVNSPTTVAAVFDNLDSLGAFLKELVKADLGVSVNISALTDDANECCKRAGITRHSVEYSLGFRGKLDKLPDRRVLELSTMCGHGMISPNLAKKMIDWVKEGRRTPREATLYLARFCTCGVFNPTRAEQILEKARRCS